MPCYRGQEAIEVRFSDEDVARHWDSNAEPWIDQVRRGWDVCRDCWNNPAFFRFLGDVKDKTVLDAGCGEGHNTRLLARMGAKVTGVDISKKMIDAARKEEQREPLGIRYEVASFVDLSAFYDHAFDRAVSFMALMGGPDYAGAVREVYRVLRPGGDLVFSITHPCFMTRGFDWMDDEQGRKAKLTVSDYFDGEPWLEHWGFTDAPTTGEPILFAVPAFPRTISEYLNTLVHAGFIVKEIEEPRPSDEACRQHPFMQGWRDHAALFLYVRAVKPG